MQNDWRPGGDDVKVTGDDSVPGDRVDDAVAGEEAAHRTAVDAVDDLLDEVELALARLDDGTYGRCEECGEPIGDQRLEGLPTARTCARCDAPGAVLAPADAGS
jgi:RNA polymerase-binding transcription factor DksA